MSEAARTILNGRAYDAAIVGGGFFGCCLALFLKSVCERVVVIETGDGLLGRASRANQARIHSGFHYPRSFVTALRSRALQQRFVADFQRAVVDDFDMLYAIARRRSKVSAQRFFRMFEAMDAAIFPAHRLHKALFNSELVEEVFLCKEFAFDWSQLRNQLAGRLHAEGIDLLMQHSVARVHAAGDVASIEFAEGGALDADAVLNVTYANINSILIESGLAPLDIKLELAEVALVEPPEPFRNAAVTIMDGPFFSAMPYPSERLHSLTHVRYTPHFSWIDRPGQEDAYTLARHMPQVSRWRHMMRDAQRYIPCFSDMRYEKSLFEVKAVLARNDRDDGRPILFHQHRDAPRLFTVMGAKIDNIYDLFEVIPGARARWRAATDRLLR